MSFRSIVCDVRDGFGSLSRRIFDVRLPDHYRGKSYGSVHELQDQPLVVQNSRWASPPLELLLDVIKRLEASESTWPSRKHVVACTAVCRSWREICKEIVKVPIFFGKLAFPISLNLHLSNLMTSYFLVQFHINFLLDVHPHKSFLSPSYILGLVPYMVMHGPLVHTFSFTT